jgi:hypothetical protein
MIGEAAILFIYDGVEKLPIYQITALFTASHMAIILYITMKRKEEGGKNNEQTIIPS